MTRYFSLILLVAGALVGAIACDEAGFHRADEPKPAPLGAPDPEAIVSLVPAATRFVLALGAEERLVAIGGDGNHPATAGTLPRVDLAGAVAVAPGTIFVPSQTGADAFSGLPAGRGVSLVEFALHDLEDLFALSRTVGRSLVGKPKADAFEAAISRPLSLIAAESDPLDRPRVAAIVSDSPFLLAGGHSFASDLVEIAGGVSVTHGGEESTLVATPSSIRAMRPDVVVLVFPSSEEDRLARARELVPAEIRTIELRAELDKFWSEPDPASTARSLRAALLGTDE